MPDAILSLQFAPPRGALAFEYADVGLAMAHLRAVRAAARAGRPSVALYERGALCMVVTLAGLTGSSVIDKPAVRPAGATSDRKTASSGA